MKETIIYAIVGDCGEGDCGPDTLICYTDKQEAETTLNRIIYLKKRSDELTKRALESPVWQKYQDNLVKESNKSTAYYNKNNKSFKGYPGDDHNKWCALRNSWEGRVERRIAALLPKELTYTYHMNMHYNIHTKQHDPDGWGELQFYENYGIDEVILKS